MNETFREALLHEPGGCGGAQRVARGGGKNLDVHDDCWGGAGYEAYGRCVKPRVGRRLFTPLKQQKSVDQLYVYVRTATAPEQTFADDPADDAADRSGIGGRCDAHDAGTD